MTVLDNNLQRLDSSVLTLTDAHETLIQIYSRYMDMKTLDMNVQAVWMLASAYHDCFETFPINNVFAMKGSGKSRLGKLNAWLLDGAYILSITEAVLFRERSFLFIDEAENINAKEQVALRELLNACYKKGGVVKRARKGKEGNMDIETFDVFRPVMIANIEGVDDVLEDRCIKTTLEKSFNKNITRRIEMFSRDPDCVKLKEFLSMRNRVSDSGMSFMSLFFEIQSTYQNICDYLMYNNSNDMNNNTQITTITTETAEDKTDILIRKLEETEIQGRDLELWLPLFTIAVHISEGTLEDMIGAAKASSQDRQETNMMENRDVVLVSFLVNRVMKFHPTGKYISIKDIVKEFLEENPEDDWFNNKWVGRALGRQNLVQARRRFVTGREIMIDFEKVKQKAIKFGVMEDLSVFMVKKEGSDDN